MQLLQKSPALLRVSKVKLLREFCNLSRIFMSSLLWEFITPSGALQEETPLGVYNPFEGLQSSASTRIFKVKLESTAPLGLQSSAPPGVSEVQLLGIYYPSGGLQLAALLGVFRGSSKWNFWESTTRLGFSNKQPFQESSKELTPSRVINLPRVSNTKLL